MNLRRHGDDDGGHMIGTATSTGAMASSTSPMDMSGGHGETGGHHHMDVTFFKSSHTPLFWDLSSAGQYAGTCIFLIFLGCLMRFLLALRPTLEARLWGKTAAAVSVIRTSEGNEKEEDQMFAPAGVATARPGHVMATVRRDIGRRWSGWRIGTAASRATYDLVIAGIGYLLMLAVMTMNVGYFLSVLGGIWLGAFLLGSLSYDDRWSHC